MNRPNSNNHPHIRRWRQFWRTSGPSGMTILFAVAVIGPLSTMIVLLPRPVVLPAFGVWSLLCAGLMALFAWCCARPRADDEVNAWDLAGAFTLIGCASAILGEIELMLEYVWPLSSKDETHD